jgi:hypothetical protein
LNSLPWCYEPSAPLKLKLLIFRRLAATPENQRFDVCSDLVAVESLLFIVIPAPKCPTRLPAILSPMYLPPGAYMWVHFLRRSGPADSYSGWPGQPAISARMSRQML